MDNCTRHAFTDGACKTVSNCRACPGEAENVADAYATSIEEGPWFRIALFAPLIVAAVFAAYGLGYAAIEGMNRAEASFQADLRR